MSLEMIQKRLKIIDDLQNELHKVKALMDETLENDAKFQEVEEEASKAREALKEKKAKVMQNSQLVRMEEQMRELRESMKEAKEVLSQELVDFYKDTGNLDFVDEEGKTKRIKFNARLVTS